MSLRHVYALAPLGWAAFSGCSTYSEDLLVFPGYESAIAGGAAGDITGLAGSGAGDANQTEASSPWNSQRDAEARPDVSDAPAASEAGPPAMSADAEIPHDAAGVPDGEPRADAEVDARSVAREAGPPDAGCLAGNALQLNGGAVGTTSRLVQDDFTLEAWVKMTKSLAGSYFWSASAILWADVTSNGNDFSMGVLNGKVVLGVGNPDTAATGTSVVATGKWVHVAATRTKADGNITVWVDGVAQATATGNSNALNASAVTRIGGSSGSNGFVGLLDEIRIWNTVRSGAQIRANMNKRLAGDESGLVGYYRFDESSGATASDSSPSANHATFKGTIAWVPSMAPVCN